MAQFGCILSTPVGPLSVIDDDQALLRVEFYHPGADRAAEPLTAGPLTQEICRQIETYFHQPGFRFDLPLALQGTDFQRRVWQALGDIPSGQVKTYGQLASELGSHARAVGGACRRNPVVLVVPCHRVVAASGIGGFNGQWQSGNSVDSKAWLLKHEGVLL